jgi:hypothetical protein
MEVKEEVLKKYLKDNLKLKKNMQNSTSILGFKTLKSPGGWNYLQLDMESLSPEIKQIINDVKEDPELKGKATSTLENKFYELLLNKYPEFVQEKKSWTRNNYDAIMSVFATGPLY